MYPLLFLKEEQHVSDLSLPHWAICVLIHPLILSLQDKGAFLLVLDAKNFEELARAYVPVKMAYGFHGTFEASV